MRDNGGEMCSGRMATSLYGRMKGVCKYVSTPTLKSVIKLRNSAESVSKSESYLEGDSKSPLYRRVLRITVSWFYGV